MGGRCKTNEKETLSATLVAITVVGTLGASLTIALARELV
jgi:hypothetical protein